MMSAALARRAEELAAAGVPFVTATVVRVQRPTSAEAGSVALVLADGTIEGFIGGSCAEHSVRAYALKAAHSGESVLLRILPFGDDPEGTEVASEEGAVTVQNPCLSGGAIEVFIEPVVPAPRVVVVGDSPIAAALLRIGAELGLDVVAGAGDVRPDDLALVVAAHGQDELGALRAGLEAGLPYVGLVASRKRGAGVIGELRGDGVAAELLERIDVPAGIDIGARTAAEIALSILAKVVAVRRDAAPAGGDLRRRPDLRHDRRSRGGHALGPARRRDVLLLLRGMQDQVRGRARACRRLRLIRSSRASCSAPAGPSASGARSSSCPMAASTLLGHVVGVARACRFRQTIVAIGGSADEVRATVDLAGTDVVVNDAYGAGCSSSIAAALAVVDARCDVMVLMLGDQPGVSADTVASLLAGRGDAPLAVCRYDDGRGHPIAFARSVFEALAGLHGDKGVWRLLDQRAPDVKEVPVAGRIPLDVDTPEDYEAVVAGLTAA